MQKREGPALGFIRSGIINCPTGPADHMAGTLRWNNNGSSTAVAAELSFSEFLLLIAVDCRYGL